MNAEQFFNNGFGADVEKVHRKHVIDLMTNFAKHYHTGGCMTAEKAFWEYWDKRFQFTSRNEKVLSLSANFRNTKEAFLAGWEAKNTKTPNNEDDMQNQHWCMCVKLKDVARDYKSTCSICGGRDAYGLSTERPEDKKKTITTT